jgi:hypothetical protein
MYDSTTPAAIPPDAAMVAGYLAPSPWAWSAVDWARFPRAVHVRIAVRAGTPDGHVLDVEQGDALPEQAVRWVQRRRAAGADPTVYCNFSTWPLVISAFTAARVAQPHYWIARYDESVSVPTMGGITAIAHQWVSEPGGNHYDISTVANHWPGVDSTPEVDMLLTDKLNPNPAKGTVNEALNAVLQGETGERSAGELYLLVVSVDNAVAALTTQVTALAAAVADLQQGQPSVLAGQASVTVTLSPQ